MAGVAGSLLTQVQPPATQVQEHNYQDLNVTSA